MLSCELHGDENKQDPDSVGSSRRRYGGSELIARLAEMKSTTFRDTQVSRVAQASGQMFWFCYYHCRTKKYHGPEA